MEAEQQTTETQDTAPVEGQGEQQQEPASEGTVVPLPKPPSRRATAAAELKETIERQGKEFREALAAERQQWQQQFSALAQRPVVVQAPQQQYQPAPQLPDPEALDREALAALDNRDMATYQRKTREAASAHAARQFEQYAQRMQPAPQQQSGVPVELLPHFMAHPEVAQHPRHVALLEAKTHELIAEGWQQGPALAAEVFRQVAEKVKSRGQQRPQYGQQAAAAISGTPGGRSQAAAGGEGPGVILTDEMKTMAKKAGMSIERYAEHMAKVAPHLIRR